MGGAGLVQKWVGGAAEPLPQPLGCVSKASSCPSTLFRKSGSLFYQEQVVGIATGAIHHLLPPRPPLLPSGRLSACLSALPRGEQQPELPGFVPGLPLALGLPRDRRSAYRLGTWAGQVGRWAGEGPTWALGGGTAGRQPSGSEPPSAGLASEHRGQALERRGLVPKDAGSWPSAARVFPELAAPHIPSGRGAAPLRRSRALGRLMRCPGRLSQRPTGSCSRRFPHPPPATASEPSPAAPPTLRRPRRAPLWRPARGGRADRGFCLDSGTPGPEGARGDGGLRTREAPRAAAGAPRVRAGAGEQGAPQAGGAGLRARW